jgi:hypothetical protein
MDGILALGAAVAREMYGVEVPVVVLEAIKYDQIRDGKPIELIDETS